MKVLKPKRPFVMFDPAALAMDLSPVEFKVYLTILSFWGGSRNEVRPSITTISRRGRVGTTSVSRAIETLRQKGMLEWQSGNAHAHRANVYRITPFEAWKLPPWWWEATTKMVEALPPPRGRSSTMVVDQPDPRTRSIKPDGGSSSDDDWPGDGVADEEAKRQKELAIQKIHALMAGGITKGMPT